MGNFASVQMGATSSAAFTEDQIKSFSPEDRQAAGIAPSQPADGAVPPATQEPANKDRPAWLPDKFKTPEDMAKAYSELERKQSNPGKAVKDPAAPPPKADGAKADPPDEPKEGSDEDAATKAVENAGLDMPSLYSEFEQTGALSEKSYESLGKAGIPKEVVDAYIEGQQLKAEALTNAAYEKAGGQEQYHAMLSWAQANLNPQEIATFNSATSGSKEALLLAVEGLHARYSAAEGAQGRQVLGASTKAAGDAFTDWAQVTVAMGDPKYQSDPAYRAEIAAKLGRSNI